jgi:hypothetical protein
LSYASTGSAHTPPDALARTPQTPVSDHPSEGDPMRPGSSGIRSIVAALLLGATAIAAAAVTARVTGHAFGFLSRDFRTLCAEAGVRLPRYTASLSLVNLMVWAATGALALMAAWLVAEHRRWLIGFALLQFLLAADDALMLHEGGPLRRHLSEGGISAVYALLGAVLLVALLRRRRDSVTLAFLLGGAFLAGSVLVDKTSDDQFFLEDASKLFGALLWTVVPVLLVGERIRDVAATRPEPAQQGSGRPTPDDVPGPSTFNRAESSHSPG